MKIYLLLHHAQRGSMENYTKVKLNWIIQQFEIQTVLKLLHFNEVIERQDLFQFQVKALLEIYSTFPIYSKALNLDQSVHFCLPSPYPLKVSFSWLQGRGSDPGFSNSLRQFIFLYLYLASMPLMQHNSFSKLESFLIFFKNGNLEKWHLVFTICSFNDHI